MDRAIEQFRQCSNCILAFSETLSAFASMYQQRQSLFEAQLISKSLNNSCSSSTKPLRFCAEPLGMLSMAFDVAHVPNLLLAQYDTDLTTLIVALNDSRSTVCDLLQKMKAIGDLTPAKPSRYSAADCQEAFSSMTRCVHSIHQVMQQTVSALKNDAGPCLWGGPEVSCQKLRRLLLASPDESPYMLVGAVPTHIKQVWSELRQSLDPVAAVLLLQ